MRPAAGRDSGAERREVAGMTWSQDHVHLRCSDYQAAVQFFVENLEAKEEGRVHNPGGSVTVSLRIGGCLYKVSPKKGDAPADAAHYHVYHLGFETNDLPAQLARMKALRDGMDPSQLPHLASGDLMKQVTRGSEYQGWIKEFLTA